MKQVTGNSYSIAPYEVTRYSKAAQTETAGEEEHEDADVIDEEDGDGRPGEETERTENLPEGIFLTRKVSRVSVIMFVLCHS